MAYRRCETTLNSPAQHPQTQLESTLIRWTIALLKMYGEKHMHLGYICLNDSVGAELSDFTKGGCCSLLPSDDNRI